MSRYISAVDGDFKTREDEDNLYIEGYFAVYNGRYDPWEENGHEVYETIDEGAFDGETHGDVRALINHDTTLVLGRTTAGTLDLKVDERGLWGSVLINRNDQDAMNLYERVKRGDVDQCSFGFEILKQDIEETKERTVFHIQDVRLHEVSVCTFPAYKETFVDARKAELKEIEKRKLELWKKDMINKLKGE